MSAKIKSLGIGLAVVTALLNNAYARSTTGYNAFRVEFQNAGQYQTDPYTCLFEAYGAVVNKCTYSVSLEFDLPIDSSGTKNVIVQDYWEPFGSTTTPQPPTFSCWVYSYAGASNSSQTDGAITFQQPSQSLTASAPVSNGESIQLICWNVPSGGGIANINWNQ
jgi:hypothetical protein